MIRAATVNELIRGALSAPTARERIVAFLAISASRYPGAVELRERQVRLSLRLRPHHVQRPARDLQIAEAAGRACAGPMPAEFEGEAVRARYYALRSQQRLVAREIRQAAERADAERRRRARALERYLPVVAARGGETEIVGAYGTATLAVTDLAPNGRIAVLACDGWRQYSKRFGARRARLAYVCGTDDSGRWAARIPGNITTIRTALAWLEPAAVAKAREAGRRVRRQGDVYLVATRPQHDGAGLAGLPRGHRLIGSLDDGPGRWLLHGEHAPAQVLEPTRYYAQRAYRMGRTGRRGAAD